MFLLGLISFFQLTFIPGLIFLKIFNFRPTSKFQGLIFSFALSQLLNYLLVLSLVIMGQYTSNCLYLVISLEFCFLLYIIFNSKVTIKNQLVAPFFPNFIINNFKNNGFYLLSFIVSILMILYFSSFFFKNLGSVFTAWDAIFSWNRWAIDWSNNHFPNITWHFPQLIPANWSLTYIIMKNYHVQTVAKSLMAFFPLMILLMFFDLAIRQNQSKYFLALIILGVMIISFYPLDALKDGYVDLAVSFFSFLPFYILFSKAKLETKEIFLINVFACSAALTKQAGLYFLLWVFFWDLAFLQKNLKKWGIKKSAGLFFMIISISVLTVLPWYLMKHFEIKKNIDQSEIPWVTAGIYGGKNLAERFLSGWSFLTKTRTGKFILPFILFLLLLSLFKKDTCHFLFYVIIPLTLIWGFFFSYDQRNLFYTFPFIAYNSGAVLTGIFTWFKKSENLNNFLTSLNFFIWKIIYIAMKQLYLFLSVSITILIISLYIFTKIYWFTNFSYYFNKNLGVILFLSALLLLILKLIPYLKIFHLLFFLIIAIPIASYKINREFLINQQITLQKKLGDYSTNMSLDSYFKNNASGKKIISDYWYLMVFPGFEDEKNTRQIALPGEHPFLKVNSNIKIIRPPFNYQSFCNLNKFNDTHFLLISNNINPNFIKIIEKRLNSGKYRLIFKNINYNFIQIKE